MTYLKQGDKPINNKEFQPFIAPGEISYKKKLRKYPSYQNSLNRKHKNL